MRSFVILPVGGGTSFKVEVTRPAGGVRVVGGFRSEAEAAAWVADEQAMSEQKDHRGPSERS
jgi:hypothetical protein